MMRDAVDSAVPLLLLVALAGACGRTALGIGPHEGTPTTVRPGAATSAPVDGKCPQGSVQCGSSDSLRCHDLSQSKDHCGACGQSCPPGIACQAGSCQQHRCRGALSFNALAITWTIDQTGGSTRYRPALGDFDGDGLLDLVGMPGPQTAMSVLYGAGDGTFPTHQVIDAAQSWHWQASAADLDGDGLTDLASATANFADQSTAVAVRFASGDRDTPFGDIVSYPTAPGATSVLLADLDADGRLDMVAGVRGGLERWRGRDGGRFERQAPLVSRDPNVVKSAGHAMDWNGDGVLDILSAEGNVLYRLGHGDGSFADETTCPLAMGAAGDVDHDHRVDLVNATGLMLGIDGCHATRMVTPPDWPKWPMRGLALADLDGDDNLDIVADADKALTIHLGDGQGGFAPPLSLPGTRADWASESVSLFADLNQDGKLDILLFRSDGWRVYLNTCP